MPDRLFIASPEIKEQPKADESEETGGQCRVFVAVSGFDRQAARPMRRGHCHVIPFWTAELGKKEWHAFQVSPRTGTLLPHGKRSCFHGRESRTVFHRQPLSAGRFGDRMKSVPGRRGRTPCRYGRFPPVGKWMKVYGFFRIPPVADTGIPVYGYR